MTKPKPPFSDPPEGIKQHWRAGAASWRVWWEPSAARLRMGMVRVELDADRPSWSLREADQLNKRARKLMDAEKGVKSGSRTVISAGSIDEIAIAWLQSPRVRSLSAVSQKNYRYDVGIIRDNFSGQSVAAITTPVAADWYDALYYQRGARMAQRMIGTLRQVMKHARRKGMVAHNPVTDLDMVSPDSRSRLLTWAEITALLKAADDLNHPAMALAIKIGLFQGQRQTDISELRADDLRIEQILSADGKGQITRLCWVLVRSKDRKKRVQRLVINPAILKDMQRALAGCDQDEWHLVSEGGGRQLKPQRISDLFVDIRARAAERCPSLLNTTEIAQFRDLRRTFSTLARANGQDPTVVDDALGNTSGENAGLRQTYMPMSDQLAAMAVDAVTWPEEETGKKEGQSK